MSILAATESEVAAAAGTDSDTALDGPPRPDRTRLLSDRTLARARWIAIAMWAVAMLYWIDRVGLTFDRNTLIIYVCTGLLAASIGRRGALSVLRDWLPFAAILVVYDLTRGAADALGRPTEWHLPLDVDRWMFGVQPTVWLQSQLKEPFAPWWEVGVSLVYVSYFILPWAVAGLLWLRDRAAWREFAVQFVAISFIGLSCFIAFPAAPPWAASQCTAAEVAGGPSNPGCINEKVGTVTSGGMLGKVRPAPRRRRAVRRADRHPRLERAGHPAGQGAHRRGPGRRERGRGGAVPARSHRGAAHGVLLAPGPPPLAAAAGRLLAGDGLRAGVLG